MFEVTKSRSSALLRVLPSSPSGNTAFFGGPQVCTRLCHALPRPNCVSIVLSGRYCWPEVSERG
jgi:hypothetical protein